MERAPEREIEFGQMCELPKEGEFGKSRGKKACSHKHQTGIHLCNNCIVVPMIHSHISSQHLFKRKFQNLKKLICMKMKQNI